MRVGDPRDLTSIQAQEDAGRAWAAREGKRVREVWVDNLSAWSDVKRPAFDGALSAVLRGDVPSLWCFAMDRFTRKGIDDIGPILGRARVVFHYEGLDSSAERDRRWIIDRAEQAREYSFRLSHNIRTTKEAMRIRGQWGNKVPYGWTIGPDKRLYPHPETWKVVLHIFKTIAMGFGARTVCKGLNSGPNPIPSPSGKRWQVSTVSVMIHHPVYEGWQITHRPESPKSKPIPFRNAAGQRVSVLGDGVEPVPAEHVRRARQTLQGLHRGGERSEGVSHLLTDLAKCAGCRGAGTCSGVDYQCARHKSLQLCESPLSARREALEDFVIDRWHTRMTNADPDDLLLVIAAERYTGLQDPENAEALASALAALATAQASVKRLVDQQAAGLFDPPFDTHLPALQREARAALQQAHADVEAATPKRLSVNFLRDDETCRHAWKMADHQLRRDLLRLAIRRVVVKKSKRGVRVFDGKSRVEIHWVDEPDPWEPSDESS
ncbi:recombinase family protein [Kitasatospora sp. NPDC127111]|uniref:recombinase family protein n=1 Tax=Kitasatospora sp. NPDC127111 TaxID=3345363 RepID=UPI00362B1F43